MAVEPPFIHKLDQKGCIASSHVLHTCSRFTKSVMVSVAVSKIAVVLWWACSGIKWTVLRGHLTISTNVGCYQARRWRLYSLSALCRQYSSTAMLRETELHLFSAISYSPPCNSSEL